MWYQKALYNQELRRIAENNAEWQAYLDSLPPRARWQLEYATENPGEAERLLRGGFQKGLPHNPLLGERFPASATWYDEERPNYEATPLHRFERFPQFAPDADHKKRELFRAMTMGQQIGSRPDDINPSLANELTTFRTPQNEYERYSAASAGAHFIEKIPHTLLYHATTNLPAVLQCGKLLSRAELAQAEGKTGLGGGSSDTISLTTNKEYANTIACTLIFIARVARGEITAQQLMSDAQNGVGAKRPFGDIFSRKGNLVPEYDAAMTGKKKAGVFDNHDGPEWTQTSSQLWERALTPEEQRNVSIQMAKQFLSGRGEAGGAEDPLIVFASDDALAQIKPENVGILTLKVAENAQGAYYHTEMEWRLFAGDALEIVSAEPPNLGQVQTAKEFQELRMDEVKRFLNGWK